jgi:hypothetical protein
MSAVVRTGVATASRAGAGPAIGLRSGSVLIGSAEAVTGARAAAAITEPVATTAMRVGSIAAMDTRASALALARNPVELTTRETISRVSVRGETITLHEARGRAMGSARLMGHDGRIEHFDAAGKSLGVSKYFSETNSVSHFVVEGSSFRPIGTDRFRAGRIDHYGPKLEFLGSTPWDGSFQVPQRLLPLVEAEASLVRPAQAEASVNAGAALAAAVVVAAASEEKSSAKPESPRVPSVSNQRLVSRARPSSGVDITNNIAGTRMIVSEVRGGDEGELRTGESLRVPVNGRGAVGPLTVVVKVFSSAGDFLGATTRTFQVRPNAYGQYGEAWDVSRYERADRR